jgi:MFS transporter, SHS family, lactate transporter
MKLFDELRQLDGPQRRAVTASFLGWTLDAFDFFVLVFVISAIADEFHAAIADVAYAITLTLAMRPVGALIFGWCADRYGRRPTLMVDILLYSLFELASAFAPSLGALLVLRALFGIAMGGEWGIGASLAMESIPPRSRGIVSGLLQEGYACGYLVAAIVYWIVFPWAGWRGMFAIGVLPALLVVYIRRGVEESPVWREQPHTTGAMWRSIKEHAGLFVYVIVLMACFNAFSHGTQDLYPTFLQTYRQYTASDTATLTMISAVGAILGGLCFGYYSDRRGRRRSMITSALCALVVVPLWIAAPNAVLIGLGGFLMQFFVQGAWGVIPAHINELSPGHLRGFFPGFAYQIGVAIASSIVYAEALLGEYFTYAQSMGVLASAVMVGVVLVTFAGPEAHGVSFRKSGH